MKIAVYPGEEAFYILRIVLVSIVHGITLSILARGGKHRRQTVAIAMTMLVLIIAVIGCIFVVTAPSILDHVSWTAYMMLLVMGGIFCFVSSDSSITERLFVYIMYVAVFMLSVGYASLMAKFFPDGNSELVQLVIRTVFSILLIILLKAFLRDRLYALVDGLRGHGVEITMFSWLIGLSVLTYVIFSYFFVDDIMINAFVLVMLTLMFFAVFAITHRIVQLTASELDMERTKGRERLLESELEAERMFVERAKAIRHDQRHHDRTVLEYLEEGKIDEARRYLGAHDESVVSEGLASWCGNPLVDVQIRIAWRFCSARRIAFSADIRIPEDIGMDDIDFVSVMGNLLENAIQAACKTSNSSVSVSSRMTNGKLLLEIRNSFRGDVPIKDGTGLESVKHILSRNGGMLEQNEKDGFLVSRVIIPVGECGIKGKVAPSIRTSSSAGH